MKLFPILTILSLCFFYLNTVACPPDSENETFTDPPQQNIGDTSPIQNSNTDSKPKAKDPKQSNSPGTHVLVIGGGYSASGNQLSLESNVSGDSEEIYSVLFGDFEPLSGTGAVFSSVGAIQLTIGGTQTAFDLQIDLLEPNAAIASPEPGTAAIATLAVLGLFVSSRLSSTRRKRR